MLHVEFTLWLCTSMIQSTYTVQEQHGSASASGPVAPFAWLCLGQCSRRFVAQQTVLQLSDEQIVDLLTTVREALNVPQRYIGTSILNVRALL